MKIKVHQSGGIVYLPTTNRLEGAATTAASSSSSSSSESKVPGFAKEMISLIKENGLNSDVTVFLNQLDRTLQKAGDPTGENLSMRDILRAQKMANQVKQNYASYQKAEQSLESQDAWAEPATSARGWLYVMDQETKKISVVSPTNFDPNKQIALTNQDLINYRRENPEMAFQSDILDNLAASVGMKTITDYARSVIKDFGKTSITGYSEKQSNSIKAGMDKIIAGEYGDIRKLLIDGPDGIYKINQESTLVDQDLNAALNYIKSTLPNSYRNTLNAKAAAEGYDPNAMLITMMYADTDRTIGANYDHTASSDAGVGGAAKKETEEKLNDHDTYLMRIATGGIWEVANILPRPNDPNDTASMMVRVSKVGPLVDDKGDILQIGNLSTILEKLEAAKATNSKDVTFGDQLLNLGERGAVVWDGESQLTDVWLPYTTEGGKIKPDFAKLQKFNEFNKAVADNPNMSTLEKSNLMWSLGLRPEELDYDPETNSFKFKESVMKMFLSFSAIASGNNLDLTDESERMLEEVDRDTGKHFVQLYNNAIKYNTIARTKSTKAVNTSYKKGKKGNLYRGNVYIPIDNEYLALHMSTNQNIPKSELTRFAAKVQATDYINSSRNDDLTGIGQFK